MAEEDNFDPYAELGLKDFGCSRDEVSKAARKLGLKYHPDKNPEPEAQAKFLVVQRAKDLLLDDKRRKDYDSKRISREKRKIFDDQRGQNMDDKRKRFKANLDSKISAQSTTSTGRGASGPAARTAASTSSKQRPPSEGGEKKKKKKKEEEEEEEEPRLSKADAEKRANGEKILGEMLAHRQKMSASASAFAAAASSSSSSRGVTYGEGDYVEPLSAEVKVKWKRGAQSQSDDSLYRMFKEYGEVEEVRFTGSKGTSAIVTYSNTDTAGAVGAGNHHHHCHAAAAAAVAAFKDSEDFQVSLVADGKAAKKKASVFTHDFQGVNVTTSSTGYVGTSSHHTGVRMNAGERDSSSSSSSSSSTGGRQVYGATGMSIGVERELVREIGRAVQRRNLLRAAQAAESLLAGTAGAADVDDNGAGAGDGDGDHAAGTVDCSELADITYEALLEKERSMLARVGAATT